MGHKCCDNMRVLIARASGYMQLLSHYLKKPNCLENFLILEWKVAYRVTAYLFNSIYKMKMIFVGSEH